MPQTIIDLLGEGVKANRADTYRNGNLIELPSEGRLIVTGDIHGHQRNLERIFSFADLANNPGTHLILQEVIHGGAEDAEGGCLSYKMLLEVVRCKLQFPDRVHMIMGNHDTAFISESEVMKDGKEMNRSLCLAMEREFGQHCADIKSAMSRFLLSQPLAIRTENRIWISHSLPADRCLGEFDVSVFERKLKDEDLVRPGPVYLLTWGRRHGQAALDEMANLFDVDLFVLGHQAQQQGWAQCGANLIIIASDHNHGCLLPIELGKSYTVEKLVESILPIASIS